MTKKVFLEKARHISALLRLKNSRDAYENSPNGNEEANNAAHEFNKALKRLAEDIKPTGLEILFDNRGDYAFVRSGDYYLVTRWHRKHSNALASARLESSVYRGIPPMFNPIDNRNECLTESQFAFTLVEEGKPQFRNGNYVASASDLANYLMEQFLNILNEHATRDLEFRPIT
jgi:hypothetical protein